MSHDSPYLTTPPCPPTAEPQLDLAFEAVGADVFARSRQLHGLDTRFVVASLDYGRAVQRTAFERGGTPQDLANQWAESWQATLKALHVAPDGFTRTGETAHQRVVKAFFLKLFDQGDIYKGTRQGSYCPRCKDFAQGDPPADGRCPLCHEPLSDATEQAYFLKASKHAKAIVAHLGQHHDFICPSALQDAVLKSATDAGVPDLCISRTRHQWAIPIPIDPDHVIDDWFDALISYLTSGGYLADPQLFERFWPPHFQILPNDSLERHALAWPALLMAAGLQLPDHLLVRGRFCLEQAGAPGGPPTDPAGLVERLGPDAVRYALLRAAPYTDGGTLALHTLVELCNADLTDRLARLVETTLGAICARRGGAVPRPGPLADAEGTLVEAATAVFATTGRLVGEFGFPAALDHLWAVVDDALTYAQAAGVATPNGQADPRELDTSLYVLAEVCRLLALSLRPFLPGAAAAIEQRLGTDTSGQKPASQTQWGLTQPQARVQQLGTLLPRIVLSAH